MKNTTRRFLILFCIGVLCYTGYRLYDAACTYQEAGEFYETIAATYSTTKPENFPSAESPNSGIAQSEESNQMPITIDFDRLLAANPDVVGWLYCPDTVIHYPVVQGATNNTYLHRMLDGTYNTSGTLFLDCDASKDFSDFVSPIFGHNMRDGSMFHSLLEYQNPTYYAAHPFLYLLIPEQTYQVQLFSAFVTSASSWVYQTSFEDVTAKATYITHALDVSCFSADFVPTTEDRILLLSTCSYDYHDARFVVLGVLTPIF